MPELNRGPDHGVNMKKYISLLYGPDPCVPLRTRSSRMRSSSFWTVFCKAKDHFYLGFFRDCLIGQEEVISFSAASKCPWSTSSLSPAIITMILKWIGFILWAMKITNFMYRIYTVVYLLDWNVRVSSFFFLNKWICFNTSSLNLPLSFFQKEHVDEFQNFMNLYFLSLYIIAFFCDASWLLSLWRQRDFWKHHTWNTVTPVISLWVDKPQCNLLPARPSRQPWSWTIKMFSMTN